MTLEALIDIERLYIEQRVQGLQEIDFVGLLTECGYTVDTFAYQKAEHYLKTFNPMVLVGEVKQETENFERDRAVQKKNSLICALPTRKIVWYPTGASFNREYCEANDILCKERTWLGGVLCSLPTDLEVSIIALDAPTMLPQVLVDRIKAWVQSKTSSEVISMGNDILIEGKKVFGMANFTHQNAFVCGFHLSFDVDMEFITSVCQKKMVKIPAGLNEFGDFNREDLISEMTTWLR